MRIITGDDTGLLKSIRVEAQKIEKLGDWRRGDAAERLCWGGPPEDRESRLVAAYESGALESRDASTGQVLCSTKLAPRVRCLEALGDRLVAVSQDGSANIVAEWCGKEAPVPPPTEQLTEAAAGEDQEVLPASGRFELPGPIAGAQVDPCNTQRLAFGGGENDLKIYDLERREVMWKAKNMKDNYLCLQQPLKISTLSWATRVAPSRSLILCGTTDGKVRLYDANAQRRPLFELVAGFMVGGGTGGHTGVKDDLPRPMTCSAVSQTRGTGWSLFVGNTMGMLREYDLRNLLTIQTAKVCPGRKSHCKWAVKQMPFRRAFRGIMGSIRAVDVHCSGDTLAAVGLGRFAYIFNVRKKEMTEKVYLKQKLCSVIFSTEERKVPQAEEEEEGEEGEKGPKSGNAEGEEGVDDEVQEGFTSGEEDAEGEPGVDDEESEDEAGEEEEDAEECEQDDSDEEDGECQAATGGTAEGVKGKRRRAAVTPAGQKRQKGGAAS